MSSVCNKLVELPSDDLDAKASLARAASIEISGALSDAFKAIEFAHGDMTKSIEVYLLSADEKIASAMGALEEVQAILTSVPISAEALEWTRHLDFDRLHAEGRRQGAISTHAGQWSRLAELYATGRVLSIGPALVEDLEQIRRAIHDVLADCDVARRNLVGVSFAVLSLQAELLDATAFAQMVAYVNTLKALDMQWVTEAAAGRTTVGSGSVA